MARYCIGIAGCWFESRSWPILPGVCVFSLHIYGLLKYSHIAGKAKLPLGVKCRWLLVFVLPCTKLATHATLIVPLPATFPLSHLHISDGDQIGIRNNQISKRAKQHRLDFMIETLLIPLFELEFLLYNKKAKWLLIWTAVGK